MNDVDLDLPDFSNHPPPPKLTFEQYEKWICEEIVPEPARRGEMTREKIIADFMKNEGRQTEEWPNFGEAQFLINRSSGSQQQTPSD